MYQSFSLDTFRLADPRKALTPQEQADQHRGWYDETMGAAHWFSLADVDPARAAMLLCQFNPNDITLAQAERQTNGETGPRDLVELRQRFEDLSRTEPGFRTLADWLGVARRLRLKHHSWIDAYAAAADIQIAPTAVETPKAEPTPTCSTVCQVAAPSGNSDQRCTRLLAELRVEEATKFRGALARVTERDGRARQTVSADIKRAKKLEAQKSSSLGTMVNSLTR